MPPFACPLSCQATFCNKDEDDASFYYSTQGFESYFHRDDWPCEGMMVPLG